MSVSLKVSITKKLRDWRQVQANLENTELFRVLQNQTINLIAESLPENNIDLLNIKGLGPKKVQKYGSQILQIVELSKQNPAEQLSGDSDNDEGLSVAEFLSRINYSLSKHTVQIYGEVYGSVNQRGKALYFKIKDLEQNALLECFAWVDTFSDKGSLPNEGDEVLIEGQVQIYPPTGRFSLQVKSLQLRGEGALKAAFDKLRNELEASGAFSPDLKRSITNIPRRVAIITAYNSDALQDFKTHIGNHGFSCDVYDVRVEGIKSQEQITKALQQIGTSSINYDCVVITRGGGSLEAMQAYNSRPVVDAVRSCKYPTISAVGHEKDISLCDLVADIRVSTPTDAGKYLHGLINDKLNAWDYQRQKKEYWIQNNLQQLTYNINNLESDFRNELNQIINNYQRDFRNSIRYLGVFINKIKQIYRLPERQLVNIDRRIHKVIFKSKTELMNQRQHLLNRMNQLVENKHNKIQNRQIYLDAVNPETIMNQGYSIVTSLNNKTIKGTEAAKKQNKLNIKFIDGTITVSV